MPAGYGCDRGGSEMPDFQKIQYFLKVAAALSFTKAAEELYISPQALNKQIFRLEEELGGRLFVRTTRKIQLTDFGMFVRDQFETVSCQYENACQAVRRYVQSMGGTLRVAFFQAISKKEVVHPLVQYLQAAAPGLKVELIGGEIDEVNDWLRDGRADLLLTNVHEYEQWPGMTVIPFMTVPAQAIVSLYHPWVVLDKISCEDMARYPILLLERKKELEADSFYRRVKSRGRHYAPNFSSLLANLENDEHYAVFPRMFESMRWEGYKYFDLPDEYAFNFSMVAMYRTDSRFKQLFKILENVAADRLIPENRL